ncbi:MAG: DUF3662 domain-containing protein [Anaerolineae bacterium]|nr:DUF3662 domain-containing protein [Anaerolineae bacterium]MDW8173177.1 DUF3662 domain-containing protein [Anaerolineae bacterium]
MDERRLAQLEAQIEQFIEGVFVGFFRRPPSAHDVALQLARALQQNLRRDDKQGLIAPDRYVVHLSPQAYQRLERQLEPLRAALIAYLRELAAQSNAIFVQALTLHIQSDPRLERSSVAIQVQHSAQVWPSTQAMQSVADPRGEPPRMARLVVNGQRTIPLSTTLLNIGRAEHNDIILDDPHVSRHHAQIRLRWGVYTLFDAESASGTFVNEVRVREHRLQNGDTIRLGQSLLLYLAEDNLSSTAHFEPVG